MSKKLVVILLAVLVMAAFLVAAVAAQEGEKKAEAEKATHEYVGADKCKACHKDIYASWEQTPHAKAWDALSAEEQKNPDCVKCHITGKTADGEMLTSVQCEACHGPGSDYKSFKIMNKKKWEAEPDKYKQMAIDAGLIFPTEENCMRCHKKEGNPNFKPFDFAKMQPKVHPVAQEETKE